MIAHCLDLSQAVNRVGATFDSQRTAGEMNAWGNSYPAEELPFGGQALVGNVPYRLVFKSPARPPLPDHIEVLGQRLAVDPLGRPARALALLAASELGPQELTVHVWLAPAGTGAAADACDGSAILVRQVTIPGWQTRPLRPLRADQFRCSHLHYPGDYGLALLLPVLWSRVMPLPGAAVTAIELLPNPLVHVFAVSLLSGMRS